MKILLTGARGFTGHYFSAAASAAGHDVVPLQANLRDRAAIARDVAAIEPGAVVHLAGISFVGHADDEAFYAVNTVGTTNLLMALAQLAVRPRSVLLASSANVYGDCRQSPIDEMQSPAPINHYGASKLAMEHMALTYLDRLPVILARPFNYTGPGQALNFVIPKLVDHFARKAPSIDLGNLHVEREFNDVRMVCDIYLALLEYGVPGETYNVCTGQPYTLQQVIDALTELSGHKLQTRVNPAFIRNNEVYRLCGKPNKLHEVLTKRGQIFMQPSLKDTLNWMLDSAGKISK